MTPKKAKLQSLALALRTIPGIPFLFRLWYAVAVRAFVFFTLRVQKKMGASLVKSIYLRRGGGREELLPGASDLDFFLLLETMSAEQEMEFLKNFWERYHEYRVPFPFLGEVLMGDENELKNWFEMPTTRSFEAAFSWKLLWGEDILKKLKAVEKPELRDIFSEALKSYWALLQPVLKLRSEHFKKDMAASESSAVHLRNAAKAALDLFRLRESLALEGDALKNLWRKNRSELALALPKERYGDNLPALLPLLKLRAPLFQEDPFLLFSELIYRSYKALDEIAGSLEKTEENYGPAWKLHYHEKQGLQDPYSLSVRELFAERLLLRHRHFVARAVLSQNTAHMYFPLHADPGIEGMRELLADLRDVSFSFDRFSVAMPVSERSFREIEHTSLIDTPFHSFYAHREIRLNQHGMPETARYKSPEPKIPETMLQKTFAELSFALRFQPQELEYLLEKMLAIVLGLRLASEHGEIVTDFDACLKRYGEKYPLRIDHLRSKIAPYTPAKSEEEESTWVKIFSLLDDYAAENPTRANSIKSQLDEIYRQNLELPKSKTLATDVWINLTPFLRMEMNAMKDRYFRERPRLKI